MTKTQSNKFQITIDPAEASLQEKSSDGSENPWRQIRSSLQQAVHDWSAVSKSSSVISAEESNPERGLRTEMTKAESCAEQLERQEIERLLKELQTKLENFSI